MPPSTPRRQACDSSRASHVDEDHPDLEGEYEVEVMTFGDRPFTGYMYEFDGIYCTAETRMDSGWPQTVAQYLHSGQLSSFEHFDAGTGDKWDWHPSGRIAAIWHVRGPDAQLKMAQSPTGELTRLEFSPRFSFDAPDIVGEMCPFPGVTEAEILGLRGARELLLMEPGIDARWLDRMTNAGVFADCESLSLYGVRPDGFDFRRLSSLAKLRRLQLERVEGNPRPPSLLELAKSRSDLVIEADRVRLPNSRP